VYDGFQKGETQMVTIDLPLEVEAFLKERATRQGMDVATYARKLLEGVVHRISTDPTIELFERLDRENATDDPEEIARRTREAEEFMQNMNRNRLESEGPNARLIYP
jgi:hypothetical protein